MCVPVKALNIKDMYNIRSKVCAQILESGVSAPVFSKLNVAHGIKVARE